MRRIVSLVALAAIVSLSGCSTPSADYVAADRATFDVVAPTLRADLDGTRPIEQLPEAERAGIRVLLDTWELRLRGAEESAADSARPIDPSPFLIDPFAP